MLKMALEDKSLSEEGSDSEESSDDDLEVEKIEDRQIEVEEIQEADDIATGSKDQFVPGEYVKIVSGLFVGHYASVLGDR